MLIRAATNPLSLWIGNTREIWDSEQNIANMVTNQFETYKTVTIKGKLGRMGCLRTMG
jgi:hypothetical protein